VKINEFRITGGSPDNSSNSFIELYNAGSNATDISSWTFTHHPTQLPVFSSVKIPAGTKLAAHGFYLLGLSNSGLVVPVKKGESTLYVRSTTGMSVGDAIEIDNGSSRELRKIAAIGTVAGLGQSPSGGGRPVEPGTATTMWQPLPDGPVITIPKGSANIPVTSVDGFEVGKKMAIGYGATYPTVAQSVEKYEVVTVTKVGKPCTQAWLSADAKAGETNIKVSSVANISVGDKIRLDIDSKGHGTETVTVTRVGTQSVRSASRGPLSANDDPGTGLDIAEPLKYNHSSNIPFSARGTGISFEPVTAFPHSSNEPVLPLGTGITLNSPLTSDHAINTVVRDPNVTTAGYQGTPVPNQWFGGPALSSMAGNMALRDAAGNIVDGLNYGGLVDPWLAEGYQAASGAGESGCYVPSPGINRGFRGAPSSSASQPDRSAGRYPDGADSGFNCRDFLLQTTITLLTATPAGSTNIKIGNVADFSVGQKIIIESGANSETAVIRTIGTTGGTVVGTATQAGTKFIPVASVEGFSAGQTITIDSDANNETAVVAAVTGGRRRFGPRGTTPVDTITVTSPLAKSHNMDAQVSGSGITLASPLTRAHDSGAQIASYLPTPGAPNQYFRKPQ
jgi:hypothetical protein